MRYTLAENLQVIESVLQLLNTVNSGSGRNECKARSPGRRQGPGLSQPHSRASTRIAFSTPLNRSVFQYRRQASRRRRGCFFKNPVHLTSKNVFGFIATRDANSRSAGLLPEQIHVTAGHQVPQRAAQLRDFNGTRLVGYLLKIENQVAVVILFRLGHPRQHIRPDLSQLRIFDRHFDDISMQPPYHEFTVPRLLLSGNTQLHSLILKLTPLHKQGHRDSNERRTREEDSYGG